MAYNAVTFLEGLFGRSSDVRRATCEIPASNVAQPICNVGPDDLPADWRVEWEERAAVAEYDGGQSREHAEAEALGEIVERMRVAGAL